MKKSMICFVLMAFFVSTFAYSQDLHSDYERILKQYVSNGNVNYAKLKDDQNELDAYLLKLSHVSKEVFFSWPEEERLAFLINLYNGATLQLILNHYPVKSIKDIGSFFKGPWKQPVVGLFGEKITLDDLEHGIIRKEYNEPRIHMALVCAAKGCPPLREEAFNGNNLNAQLDDQSYVFLSSSTGLFIDNNKAYLSKIFDWYGEDFPSVRAFAEKHSGKSLEGLSLGWIKYDWRLNEE